MPIIHNPASPLTTSLSGCQEECALCTYMYVQNPYLDCGHKRIDLNGSNYRTMGFLELLVIYWTGGKLIVQI